MKKTVLIIFLIFSAFAVQSLTAEGTKETAQRSITVKGVGSVSSAPDVVRLNLGVQSMDKELRAAIADNDDRIKSVVEIIKNYGISDKDYRTSNFSVYYQQPYNPESSPEDGTYNVSNNIFIEFQDISKIGNFIEEALSAGANQFYGLEYAISETEQLKKQARAEAIENAIKLAEETAGYAGLQIGDILRIEETPWYGGGQYYTEGYGGMKDSSSRITVPGEKTVEVQVTLTIELE